MTEHAQSEVISAKPLLQTLRALSASNASSPSDEQVCCSHAADQIHRSEPPIVYHSSVHSRLAPLPLLASHYGFTCSHFPSHMMNYCTRTTSPALVFPQELYKTVCFRFVSSPKQSTCTIPFHPIYLQHTLTPSHIIPFIYYHNNNFSWPHLQAYGGVRQFRRTCHQAGA
jgi:hypothetical protein